LRTVLREATALVRTEWPTVMVAVAHPRSLRTKLGTVLREAATLLRTERPAMMTMLHPRTLRTELWAILREATALLWTKAMVMMAVLHARPARTILRKLLSRLRPHCPGATVARSRLRTLILRARTRPRLIPLRPRLTRLLRAIVLRLPLLTTALKALRHFLPALHLAGKTLAHLALKTLLHLRVKLRAALIPRLRPTIAALWSLRHRARSTGLRSRSLWPRLTPIVTARLTLAVAVKWRPAISIATSVAPFTLITSISTRLIRAEITTLRRAHLAIALAARLPRLVRPRLRLRLARLLRIAILRTPLETPIELREKLIRRDASIAAAIKLLQHVRRILHLLLIDHAIVVRIEQIEKRRPHPAPIARASTTTLSLRTRLAIGPLPVTILAWRQALRCIRRLRRLRWLRRIVLRAEHRCRERHRDRGK
jgi:hypothetical protein